MNSTSDLLEQIEILRRENARLTAAEAEQEKARRQLEEESLSQRLESVGRLAGGAAHHLNNALTAILGYAGLALMDASPGNDLYSILQNIQAAAQRASEWTHQLLTFARQTTFHPQIIHLNPLITERIERLRALIPANIILRDHLAPDLNPVCADPGQIEQAIVHLLTNARDAMPEGGVVTLSTANVRLAPDGARPPGDLLPGDYVLLSVSDTGTGMDETVKARLFDPFFTTKPQGQGTGLGLAACYGIVQQSGGAITVTSEPEQGATFQIYLPQAKGEPARPGYDESKTAEQNRETILLVEEDALIRSMAAKALRSEGYAVLEAATGAEALRMADDNAIPIHLLMSEILLPQIGGKELARQLLATRPQIKALFTAGHVERNVSPDGVAQSWITVLQKPFTAEQLLQKVRQTLDSAA